MQRQFKKTEKLCILPSMEIRMERRSSFAFRFPSFLQFNQGPTSMLTSKFFAAGSAALLASHALAGMISATFMGGTAVAGSLPTGTTDPSMSFTTTVTDEVEFQYRWGVGTQQFGYDIDIKDSAIRLTMFAVSPEALTGFVNQSSANFFSGYVFRDVNHAMPDFTGLTLGDVSPGMPFTGGFLGGPAWRGQFYVVDADTLVINMAGIWGHSGEYMEFNVATVPAPGAAALLGAAGLLVRRRR